MKFEVGNPEEPTGNLVLYTNVLGQNPIEPGARIIAAHIVVSLIASPENIPAVTFPPLAFKEKDDLMAHLELIPAYDLYRMPDFQLPQEPDAAGDYINKRLDKVNDYVKEYVDICSTFMAEAGSKPRVRPPAPDNIPEALDYMEKLSRKVLNTFKYGQSDNELLKKFEEYISEFENSHPEYPIYRLNRLVTNPTREAEKLLHLNFEQYRAILFENYEKAEQIHRDIQAMEQSG